MEFTKTYFALSLYLILILSCKSNKDSFDASGVFEAEEIIVSAESTGKILCINVNEGDNLKAGQELGLIDCTNLSLQKSQVEASLKALNLKQNEASPQVQIYNSQMEGQRAALATQKQQMAVLEKEHKRAQNLVKAEAAPIKQLDDVEGQIEVLKKQMEVTQSQMGVISQQISSVKSQTSIQNRGIMSESEPLKARLAQFDDQIGRCKIINPVEGTVLVKYTEAQEVTSMGKPLYKLANLDIMTLRAYVSGSQLSNIKLDQEVNVYIDNGKDSYKELKGTISWISSQAEFTPKTIQTKDERANLVYAIKIKVKNDGYVKIGMYGEVRFSAIAK